jgi:hypothetical protein
MYITGKARSSHGQLRNMHKILVEKPGERRSFEILLHIWKDDIKKDIRKIE